jgi:hypothetical protein
VSVGGMLDMQFWDTILVKIPSIEEVTRRGAKKKKEELGVCS